jgi:hypothetical protein
MKITTNIIYPTFAGFALAQFALSPIAQAISPAPDGGYPGGNTAEGQNALLSLSGGTYNAAVGFLSLESNVTGNLNTAVGAGTLLVNTADQNTAAGAGALLGNSAGAQNTAIGAFALFSNTIGSGNTALGVNAGANVVGADNVICIGAPGAGVSNSCFIGNIRGVTTSSPDAIPVLIDSFGQLGTISSSRRFKHDIRPMDNASEAILAFKPVTFHYKADKTNTAQFGLIAEEVAAVNPDLVVPDKSGDIYTVRYDAVNAMLLNEFLKEHRKVEAQARQLQQQKATMSELKKGMATVVAELKEQAAQIQKVTAEIEVNRSAPTQVTLKTP